MGLDQGYTWYAKYIAEPASQSSLSANSIGYIRRLPFQINRSVHGGSVLIVDADIAPVILALVTLTASFVIPILFTRIARAIAVLWCARHTGEEKPAYGALNSTPDTFFHFPVILASAGLWASDAWTAINLSWKSLRYKNFITSLAYAGVVILSIFGLLTGPLVAFMLSRNVESGFAGTIDGLCIPPMNFSVNATNVVSLGEYHHGRAIELLPWIGSFSYYWSEITAQKYTTEGPIVDPLSQVKYSRLDYCLLNDDDLCHSGFNRTHVVTANLSGSQLGLWSGGEYSISLEANCVRLNSTTIAFKQDDSPYWGYGFAIAPDAVNLTSVDTWLLFGEEETERYARKKNVITNSFFVDGDGDRDFNWAEEIFPPSLRALDVASFTVLTVLPSIEPINQQVGDELYLPPLNISDFFFAPDQLAHVLCWENTFISTPHNRTRLTTSHIAGDFTQILKDLSLPALLSPLIFYINNEFVLKPARYLRANTLLQAVADTPKDEYAPIYALPVPFGAEMHRWGHIGLLDIASKATRMATGYYARGNSINNSMLAKIQSTPHLLDLCQAVRETRAGAISIPIRDLVVLLVLLVLAVITWIGETVLVVLAQKGWAGFIRLWLVLPAAKPTSLNASIVIALEEGREMKDSASGWPLIKFRGVEEYPGPMIEQTRVGKWRLRWGLDGLQTKGKMAFE